MKEKKFELIGYNINPVPLSEIIWLNKPLSLSFDLKVNDDPIENSAIVDIDFYTKSSGDTFEKERAKSFVSITVKGKYISLSYNDFKIKSPDFVNLIKYDNDWHKFDIAVFQENLWCPNKKCKFQDCHHVDAEVLSNEYLGWTNKGFKQHRRVSVSIDGSDNFYFNYMSNANNAVISFGNNNFNLTDDKDIYEKIINSKLISKSSVSLKNITAMSGEDEIEFSLKNSIE